MNTEETKEAAESVSFWLADENKQARRELEQRRPELAAWIDKIETMVKQRLAEREAQEGAKVKA